MSCQLNQLHCLTTIPRTDPSTCRIDQGSCISFDERVIPLTASILSNLLHVGFPIDLGVCSRKSAADSLANKLGACLCRSFGSLLTGDFPYDESAENRVRDKKKRRDPSCLLWILGQTGDSLVEIHCACAKYEREAEKLQLLELIGARCRSF